MKFNDRLQYVASVKKTDQINIVKDLNIDSATVNRWWLGKVEPRAKSIRLLADYFSCDYEWLASGKGEPFPSHKIEKAIERRFLKRRQADLENEVAARTSRDRFKMQCLGLFDELFEFVGDLYGEDRDAVDDFLDKLEKLDSDFSAWRDEKKQARANLATLRGGAKIANNGE